MTHSTPGEQHDHREPHRYRRDWHGHGHWNRWNADWPRPLFHETGLLILAAGVFAPFTYALCRQRLSHYPAAVTTLLAGIGIIGLALGFAFQDIAENFIAGVLMAFRRPLQEGDIVEHK